jgi:hypothetical protein
VTFCFRTKTVAVDAKDVPSPNNCPILWQRSFPFQQPSPFCHPDPDFLLHCSRRRPRMWFSSKRTTRSRPKPIISTGNPGKPRDLRCAIRVPQIYRSTTTFSLSSWRRTRPPPALSPHFSLTSQCTVSIRVRFVWAQSVSSSKRPAMEW